MTTIVQKSLLGLSVLMAIILVAVLTSKKFTLESRRNALLIEMVANISTDLDKLDSGFDTIVSRTEAAKGQLRRLAALHRDNLMICALLHEKHVKKEHIMEKTDQYDIEERIIHKLRIPVADDELHHSGWNFCSSCHDSPKKRDILVLPCRGSDHIYFIDVSGKRELKIKKTVEPEELHRLSLAIPQTSHCSPTGEIIVSTIGKPNGDILGSFITIDSETLETKGVWTQDKVDFWYQPYHDVLVSSKWGASRVIRGGFSPSDLKPKNCGQCLNFYSWSERRLIQTLDLGVEGRVPFEIRFLHDPTVIEGFVGCTVMSNVYRFFNSPSGKWDAEKVIDIPSKKVDGWVAPEIEGMITDILLSLDDKYLYFSNWLHGDVRQYDITDRKHPLLKGQVFLGGSVLSDSKVHILEDKELDKQPDPVFVKGRRLHGAPQMLQLSLDGRRLYVTTSIFSPWDKQFYPEQVKNGSTMVKLDIDVENGGMTLDKEFLIDFGADRDEILLAHEMRYKSINKSLYHSFNPENFLPMSRGRLHVGHLTSRVVMLRITRTKLIQEFKRSQYYNT